MGFVQDDVDDSTGTATTTTTAATTATMIVSGGNVRPGMADRFSNNTVPGSSMLSGKGVPAVNAATLPSSEGFRSSDNTGMIGPGAGTDLLQGLGVGFQRALDSTNQFTTATSSGSSESNIELLTSTLQVRPGKGYDASKMSKVHPVFGVEPTPADIVVGGIQWVNEQLLMANDRLVRDLDYVAAEAASTTLHPHSARAREQRNSILGRRGRAGIQPVDPFQERPYGATSLEQYSKRFRFLGISRTVMNETAYGSVSEAMPRTASYIHQGRVPQHPNLWGQVLPGQGIGVAVMRTHGAHEFQELNYRNRGALKLVPYVMRDGSMTHYCSDRRMFKDLQRNTEQSNRFRYRLAEYDAHGHPSVPHAGLTVQAYAAQNADQLAIMHGGMWGSAAVAAGRRPFDLDMLFHDIEFCKPTRHVPGSSAEDSDGWVDDLPVQYYTLQTALTVPLGIVHINDYGIYSKDPQQAERALADQFQFHDSREQLDFWKVI